MKKRTITTAVLAAAVAPLALAQSSLNLYGRYDAGIDYTSAVRSSVTGAPSSQWKGQSGEWGASWLGFLGEEDLGGGNAAFFQLEAGLNMMTGAGAGGTGMLFNRKSFVGLKSRTWGALKVGRDLTMSNNQWDMDPMMGELYSATGLMRWRNAQVLSNAVGYQSPVKGGFDVFVQYAPSEQAGLVSPAVAGQYGRSDALQLTYTDETLELRAQYEALRDANGKFSNIFVASRELFAGVAYKLSATGTLQAGYNHLSAPDTPAGLARMANHYWAGGKFQVTPQWLLSGGLYHISVGDGSGDATHDAGGHANLMTAGVMYYLSKNTFLYGSVAHVHNSGDAAFGVGARNPGSDNANLNNPLPGHAQNGLYAGINSSF